MPKSPKKSVKPKKKMGRPRKYAKKKEAYSVYNKKRPVMRLYPEEKDVILYLRKNPDELRKLKDQANSRYSSSFNNPTTSADT